MDIYIVKDISGFETNQETMMEWKWQDVEFLLDVYPDLLVTPTTLTRFTDTQLQHLNRVALSSALTLETLSGLYKNKWTKNELVKTYFQLNAYNEMKTQDDLLATADHIQSSSECMANNLNKINSNSTKDKYDSAFEELLRKNQEEERGIFSKKQSEQQEDLDRINNKIAQLEDIQGKVNNAQDTKIKSVKGKCVSSTKQEFREMIAKQDRPDF